MREELDSVKAVLAEVVTELKNQAVTLQRMNDVLSTHDAKFRILNQMIQSNTTLKSWNSEINTDKQMEGRTRRETGTTVAFFARLNTSLANLGDNQMIPFQDVRTDTHSAFHGNTGVFTCPESGYYYFLASLMAFPSADMYASIILNGNWVVALYAHGSQSNDAHDLGTAGGIAYLNVNDKVWVRILRDEHHGSGNMLFEQYTSFAGFKI